MLNKELGDALAWWMKHCRSDRRMPNKYMATLQKHGILHNDGGDECEALEPLFDLVWNHGPEVMAQVEAAHAAQEEPE